MRLDLIAVFALTLAMPTLPAVADPVPADCAGLVAPLQAIDGYAFQAPPAANEGDWCVFDGATLRTTAADRPNFLASRVRLQGTLDDGALVALAVDIAGFRVQPKAGDRSMDDRLRSLFRLQTAVVSGSAAVNGQVGQLEIRDLTLALQDGAELRLDADLQGAGLDAVSILAGSLTRLELQWRNDGRVLRPLMELAGERITPGATGIDAVDATRAVLGDLVAALPATILADEADKELLQLVAALPQGRGRLTLALQSSAGISAARVAVAALSAAPIGPESLGRLFAGSQVTVDWLPGLAP